MARSKACRSDGGVVEESHAGIGGPEWQSSTGCLPSLMLQEDLEFAKQKGSKKL